MVLVECKAPLGVLRTGTLSPKAANSEFVKAFDYKYYLREKID